MYSRYTDPFYKHSRRARVGPWKDRVHRGEIMARRRGGVGRRLVQQDAMAIVSTRAWVF